MLLARRILRRPYGATLLELATGLALGAVALSMAVPPGLAARDRWAVRAASAEVAALLARARAEAPARGGMTVTVDAPAGTIRLLDGDSVVDRVTPIADHRVLLELGGSARQAELVFDALGLGRMASRRLVLTRGRASDTLTVSSYGRVSH